MVNSCRGCGSSNLDDAFTLGSMPPVNLFVSTTTDPFEEFPLDVVFCNSCTLLQLKTPTDPKKLFSNYQHLSSASQTNVSHLKEVSSLVQKTLIQNSQLPILEIGSNDGSLLKEVRTWSKTLGIKTVSIDPAQNLSAEAKSSSDFHYTGFFDELSARTLKSEHGLFQFIVAVNVAAHTPNLHSFLKGVASILDQNGTFLLECTDVAPTILSGQFDTVYHEHYSYFSEYSIRKALDQVNLVAVKIEKLPTQGGSLRVFAKKSKYSEKFEAPDHTLDDFKNVANTIETFKTDFLNKLNDYKKSARTIVGLGAPARGVVILQTLKLNKDLISWIIDDTSFKQNRSIPGTGIKIQNWESLCGISDDAAFVLFSWNYKIEIIEKLKKQGIKKATILVPFPKIEEINL
jgi:hypothetical protein